MPTKQYRDLTIAYHDEAEIKTLIAEIFKDRAYYVELPTDAPRILDIGAHIGLATLYLARLYPKSQITCVEPNQQNLKFLRENLEQNQIEAKIIEAAVVGKKAHHKLYTNNQWTVFSSLEAGGWTGLEQGEGYDVATVQLSELISEPIDLVKMDIEGLEQEVLAADPTVLALINHLLLEFHATPTRRLTAMLDLIHPYFSHVIVRKDERRERKRGYQLYLIEAKK